RLAELHPLGFPLLSGTSRKSFVARTPSNASDGGSRLAGSIAAMTASSLAGAHIVRVHDVKDAVASARVAEAVLQANSLQVSSSCHPESASGGRRISRDISV